MLFDLIVAGWGLNPGVELDFYTHIPPNERELKSQVGNGRLFLPSEDEYRLTYERFFVFNSFDSGNDWYELRATFLPNLSIHSGISMVNNYDPMLSGRYDRWMSEIAKFENIQSRSDLLDLMAVSVIQTEDENSRFGVNFEPRKSFSRVNWVPCSRNVANEEAAWDMVISKKIDFSESVIIEDNLQFIDDTDCVGRTGAAEIIAEQPNQIEIQVDAQSDGWLVVSDLWYPGWRATIDGDQAAIYRANYLFRAIQVPAGSHVVRFSYQLLSLYLGMTISLLACLFLLGFFCWQKRSLRL